MTMFVPDEEWTQKYGKLKDQKVTYNNGSELTIKDQKITISAKNEEDMLALTKEGNKILEGIMKNIDDAEIKRAQENRAAESRRSRVQREMDQNAKTRSMRSLDIETDFDLQKAQHDWIKGSPLFSHEQKMYAAIDADTAAKQRKLEDRLNDLRTEMIETDEKMGITDKEQADIDKKYGDDQRDELEKARTNYNARTQPAKEDAIKTYRDDWLQRKEAALANAKGINRKAAVNTQFVHEYEREVKKINDQHQSAFQQSNEYKAYKDYERTSTADKVEEVDTLKNRKMLRQRGDVEGHAIDKMQAVGMQKIQMEAESKKMMLDAAMRLPVRGGLEESYNMVNDELIKQGEAQRLGGNHQQQVELSDQSLKPVLDRLDKMFQKLEDKLQTGVPVKVS